MPALFLLLLFVAELGAWGAIGYGVFALFGGAWVGGAAAAVAVSATLMAWGRWAAPRAAAPPSLARATKAVVFTASVGLLAAVGHGDWALGLAVVIVVALVGVRLTGGVPPSPPRPR